MNALEVRIYTFLVMLRIIKYLHIFIKIKYN